MRLTLLVSIAVVLLSCRRHDKSSTAAPVPSTAPSAKAKTPATTVTLEQLQNLHAELIGMAEHHEPTARQLEVAKAKLGAPHERKDDSSWWYAWNPASSSHAPSGCWQLTVGAGLSIGMTVRSKCGM